MKNIKFRYWNTISNIMVNDPEMPYKEGWTIEQLFSERGWVWMQFTGLLDKQGKDIYEGDIVQTKNKIGTVVNKREITFKELIDNYEGYETKVGIGFNIHSNDSDDGFNIEIIGNIYENKELITN